MLCSGGIKIFLRFENVELNKYTVYGLTITYYLKLHSAKTFC